MELGWDSRRSQACGGWNTPRGQPAAAVGSSAAAGQEGRLRTGMPVTRRGMGTTGIRGAGSASAALLDTVQVREPLIMGQP